MTVSIALCTYNGEKYLRQQIDSFLAQTVLPDEIVVCDDGSADRTLAILQEYAGSHPGIAWNIHRNASNLRAPANFEQAVGLCSGEVIFLADQDDVWEKDKIGQMVRFLQSASGYDAVFTNAILIDEKGDFLPGTLLDHSFFSAGLRVDFHPAQLFYYSLLLGNIITGATMAVRRSALSELLPFQLQLHRKLWHDGWIGFALMARGRIGYLDVPLIRYRVHEGQQVGLAGKRDPFEEVVLAGVYDPASFDFRRLSRMAHFTRYLSAYLFMKELEKRVAFAWPVGERIESEYRRRKQEYLASLSWPGRKFRLLKWWVLGINDTSFIELLRS
jgi:glycosyltransferase involved in cell wall biosynthesis